MMSIRDPTNKEHRRRLHRVWPYCFWCEREVRLCRHVVGRRMPADMATVDHIYDRRTLERMGPDGGHVVLACWQCNNVRSWRLPRNWMRALERMR